MKALTVILLGIVVLASSTHRLMAEHASVFSIALLWLAGILPGIGLGVMLLRRRQAGGSDRRR